jgi:predicted MFS family arabinose efflux permease
LHHPASPETPALTRAASFACAVACGVMVANIYYAQPLIGLIAPALGIAPGTAGLIVTLTQLGYGAGLLLIVPLADRLENRRLIVGLGCASALATAATGASLGAASFLVAAVASGMLSAAAQIVVPFVAGMTPEHRRGQAVGNVMAGLLAGIMLARPAASAVASVAGWRGIFFVSAALELMLAGWLWTVLPAHRPAARDRYGAMLRSMVDMVREHPALRRRAAYQGLLFAAFNLFWTAAPLMLARGFGFDQRGIALFGLAGAAGATVAPVAGRLGDRGHVRVGTWVAISTMFAACWLSGVAVPHRWLWAVVIAALALDGATQLNQVLGQRVIFGLPTEARGRLNATYMTMVFALGATGSEIATLTYEGGGWWGAMGAGMALAASAALLLATERRRPAS